MDKGPQTRSGHGVRASVSCVVSGCSPGLSGLQDPPRAQITRLCIWPLPDSWELREDASKRPAEGKV